MFRKISKKFQSDPVVIRPKWTSLFIQSWPMLISVDQTWREIDSGWQ